jgi:hypothetical protein
LLFKFSYDILIIFISFFFKKRHLFCFDFIIIYSCSLPKYFQVVIEIYTPLTDIGFSINYLPMEFSIFKKMTRLIMYNVQIYIIYFFVVFNKFMHSSNTSKYKQICRSVHWTYIHNTCNYFKMFFACRYFLVVINSCIKNTNTYEEAQRKRKENSTCSCTWVLSLLTSD